MKAGIITALPQETKAILKSLQNIEVKSLHGCRFFSGCSGRSKVSVIESGMGIENAERAAELLVMEDRPDLLISAGLGGGVNSSLATGDLVLARRILQWREGRLEEIDFVSFPIAPDPAIQFGTFITGGDILNKKKVATLLCDGFPFPVLEMESAPIATVAARHGIPFLGIRAVSDPWDEELLFGIEEFCDNTLQIRPLKVLVTILHRPWIVPQLIRLATGSRVAAANLAEVAAMVISRL